MCRERLSLHSRMRHERLSPHSRMRCETSLPHTHAFFVSVECFSGQKVWSAVSVGFFGQKQRENLPSVLSFKHFNKLLTDGSSELHHLYFASLNRLYW
jgi:hypothetical protein